MEDAWSISIASLPDHILMFGLRDPHILSGWSCFMIPCHPSHPFTLLMVQRRDMSSSLLRLEVGSSESEDGIFMVC